jgi:hypothetical protein
LFLFLLALGFVPPSVSAPVNAASQVAKLKAAYLVNFAKYVEWPSNQPGGTQGVVRIAVVGDNAFADLIERTAAGRLTNTPPIVVSRVRDLEDIQSPHILYVPPSEGPRLKAILETVKGMPTLTVGEDEDFMKQGGMIYFVLVRDELRFSIDLELAESAELTVRSRMLEVAHQIKRRGNR